jgi:hypothetical protein
MEQVPLSLYLQLQQGERADLSAVSRAAIEFAQLIEAMAAEVYPGCVVRVEAISATDASFGWNTVVKVYEDLKAGILAGAAKNPKKAWLAAFVALRILNNAIDWTQEKVMDWLISEDAPSEARTLSANERADLAQAIVTELRKGTAESETERLFRELRRDPKIEGAGVTSVAGRRPAMIVSRSDFVKDTSDASRTETERTQLRRVHTTLVSPVLMMGDRRWKFQSATGEFGAPIKDQEFLARVLSGSIDIRLRAGLVMEVDLETKERLDEGVWVIESRAVTKVHGWRNAPEQQDLLSGSVNVEPDEEEN